MEVAFYLWFGACRRAAGGRWCDALLLNTSQKTEYEIPVESSTQQRGGGAVRRTAAASPRCRSEAMRIMVWGQGIHEGQFTAVLDPNIRGVTGASQMDGTPQEGFDDSPLQRGAGGGGATVSSDGVCIIWVFSSSLTHYHAPHHHTPSGPSLPPSLSRIPAIPHSLLPSSPQHSPSPSPPDASQVPFLPPHHHSLYTRARTHGAALNHCGYIDAQV